MRIAVSVESTCDLSKELLNKYDIKVIAYTISVKDKMFKDGEYTTEEVFRMVEEVGVLPKTTAINQFEYAEYFKNLLTEYDQVVHICLSSGLSSSCANAKLASADFDKVYVVDSETLSTGIGLLAIYARELADQGFTGEQIKEKLDARKQKLQVSFVVERLDYLHKGGRCTGFQLLGANLLRIRPKILVKDGKMGQDSSVRYRGDMGKVMDKYAQDVFAKNPNPDLERVFITCTSTTPEMRNALVNACEKMGFKHIHETYAGCTIGSHCGAHTMGLLFFTEKA